MKIEPSTIHAAFDMHHQCYATRPKAWGIPYHVKCWRLAEEAFDRFNALDALYGRKRLSECLLDDSGGIWRLLEETADIKPNKHGPSIVAMSKFLHFWNPRLFVIVDSGVIWGSVLRHCWLWDEVKEVRSKVEAILPHKRTDASDKVCDALTYLSILLWAAKLVGDNSQITSDFAKYVSDHADGHGLPLAEYEGAAVEWFLEGLVELPPAGVKISKTTPAIRRERPPTLSQLRRGA